MRVCDDPAGRRGDWRPGPKIETLLPTYTRRAAVPRQWTSSTRWQGLASAIGLGRQKPLAGRGSNQSEASWIDPLYLFACGIQWHRQGEPSAGWELVRSLRSAGDAVQVAGALLARASNAHLPVGGPEVAAELGEQDVRDCAPETGAQTLSQAVMMNTPYGLEIIENCQSCKLRRDKWFCSLSPEALKSFSAASHLSTYPGGAVLFVEGQVPRGAFVLCSGRVKLSTTSREGKVLILKMAEPGDPLGLSAVVSGTPYELRAETLGPCQVNFIEREALMKLLEKHVEVGLHTAQALSKEFQSAYRDIHELVLARSSAGKLARLLLSWSGNHERAAECREIRIRSSLTHEEMAQMIGSSRETVTRLLSDLKKKELIRLEGSTLVIRNRTALEALAA